MKYHYFKLSLDSLKKQKHWLALGCLCLTVTNFIQSVLLFQHSERVVIVPPDIPKTFWIEKNKVSSEYLEAMSIFVVNLLLDVSPSNIEFSQQQLLKYISPGFYTQMKERLHEESERIKREGITTYFKIQKLKVKENMEVNIEGILTSFVGGDKVNEEKQNYKIGWDFEGGRISLLRFEREV